MDENNLHAQHGQIRHETTDINIWAVGKFGILLAVVVLVSLGLLFGLMKYFQSQEATAMAREIKPAEAFPEPRLQTTPVPDLQKFRAAEDHVLDSYGWVDQSKGVVRIPIDRAIDIMAQKGLPSRPMDAKKQQAGSQ
jgi:hypothetical protein